MNRATSFRSVFATGTEIILRKETVWLDPIIKCQSSARPPYNVVDQSPWLLILLRGSTHKRRRKENETEGPPNTLRI